jgi:hypothetical protein
VAVQELGYWQAAEDLLRSAWAYALVIDHKPLMARLRERLSSVSFWGGQRIGVVTIRLGQVRKELAHPIYRGSAQARELGERIEQFCRETVVADLHSLPGG